MIVRFMDIPYSEGDDRALAIKKPLMGRHQKQCRSGAVQKSGSTSALALKKSLVTKMGQVRPTELQPAGHYGRHLHGYSTETGPGRKLLAKLPTCQNATVPRPRNQSIVHRDARAREFFQAAPRHARDCGNHRYVQA
jgi:hypothetical protein